MNRFKRMFLPRLCRQSGITLLETIAAIAIASVATASIFEMITNYLDDVREKSVASYQASIASAAAKYINDHLDKSSGFPGTKVVRLSDLQAKGFVVGLAPMNLYKQIPCLIVTKDSQGLHALLINEGGEPLPVAKLGHIASMSGDGGGFVSSTGNSLLQAYGAYGSWQQPLARFNATCATDGVVIPANRVSRLATLVNWEGSRGIADFLYRNSIPDNSSANTMATNLDMNQKDILNVDDFKGKNPILKVTSAKNGDKCTDLDGAISFDTQTKRVIACVNGIWKYTAESKGSLNEVTGTCGRADPNVDQVSCLASCKENEKLELGVTECSVQMNPVKEEMRLLPEFGIDQYGNISPLGAPKFEAFYIECKKGGGSSSATLTIFCRTP